MATLLRFADGFAEPSWRPERPPPVPAGHVFGIRVLTDRTGIPANGTFRTMGAAGFEAATSRVSGNAMFSGSAHAQSPRELWGAPDEPALSARVGRPRFRYFPAKCLLMAIFLRFKPEGRTTENRGVPGSSPGLAIGELPAVNGFSGAHAACYADREKASWAASA